MRIPRTFTQAISSYVYEAVAESGEPFAGIFYQSRLGDKIHSFALFEGEGRWTIENPQTSVIALDDVDLVQDLEVPVVALEGVNI